MEERISHLIVDGRGRADMLGDAQALSQMLLDCVHISDMEVVSGPFITEIPLSSAEHSEVFKDTGGPTVMMLGMAILSTSHISIHAWPQEQFFSFDLFSCKPFHHRPVLEHLKKVVGAADLTIQTVNRPTIKKFNHEPETRTDGPKEDGCAHHWQPVTPEVAEIRFGQ